MISEFHDLSAKIDRLAAVTQALRAENATLRQANTSLAAENDAFRLNLARAQARLMDLLAKLPTDDAGARSAQPDEAAQ